MQTARCALVKGVIEITKMLDGILDENPRLHQIKTRRLMPISRHLFKLIDKGMSAIEMLSYANYEINLQRLEGIKPDQNEDDASLFSSSLPINNFLFGGDSKTLIKRIELSKKSTEKSRENTSKK